MSKSLGNFFTVREVLKLYSGEVIRFFILSSHYRSPLNYSEENLTLAARALMRLYQSIKDVVLVEDDIDEQWLNQYNLALNDDFNTPEALSVLFQLSHEINRTKSPKLAATLKHLAKTLGLLQESSASFLKAGLAIDEMDSIAKLIEERLQARLGRDWAKADEIRKTLLEQGIELEDGADGTTWRKIHAI